MLVLMKADATVAQISGVIKALEKLGLKPHPTRGSDRISESDMMRRQT